MLKLDISQPKHAAGTVACVPDSEPPPPTSAPGAPAANAEQTYLTLDRRNIVRADPAVRLTLAPVRKSQRNPLLTEQRKWEMRFDNMGPNVWHDRDAGKWRAWYSSFTSCSHPGMNHTPQCCQATASDCTVTHPTEGHGNRAFALLYAESMDGLSWVKPSLGLVEFEGSTDNNMVGGLNETTGTSVILDTSGGTGKWKSFGCRKVG